MQASTAPLSPAELAALSPGAVWKHFATLCDFPRPSRQEGRLREHLRGWALERGLAAIVDPTGNLIIRKPASPGYKRRAGRGAAVPHGHRLPEECR